MSEEKRNICMVERDLTLPAAGGEEWLELAWTDGWRVDGGDRRQGWAPIAILGAALEIFQLC